MYTHVYTYIFISITKGILFNWKNSAGWSVRDEEDRGRYNIYYCFCKSVKVSFMENDPECDDFLFFFPCPRRRLWCYIVSFFRYTRSRAYVHILRIHTFIDGYVYPWINDFNEGSLYGCATGIYFPFKTPYWVLHCYTKWVKKRKKK